MGTSVAMWPPNKNNNQPIAFVLVVSVKMTQACHEVSLCFEITHLFLVVLGTKPMQDNACLHTCKTNALPPEL